MRQGGEEWSNRKPSIPSLPLESHGVWRVLRLVGLAGKIWFSNLSGYPYIFIGKSAHEIDESYVQWVIHKQKTPVTHVIEAGVCKPKTVATHGIEACTRSILSLHHFLHLFWSHNFSLWKILGEPMPFCLIWTMVRSMSMAWCWYWQWSTVTVSHWLTQSSVEHSRCNRQIPHEQAITS
jgi:hypothetical protein